MKYDKRYVDIFKKFYDKDEYRMTSDERKLYHSYTSDIKKLKKYVNVYKPELHQEVPLVIKAVNKLQLDLQSKKK